MSKSDHFLRSVVPLAMFSFFHTIQGDAKHDRDAGGFGWAPTQPSYPGSGLFHRNRWAGEPGSKGLRMYLSLVKVNSRSYIFSPISSLRAWIQCASPTRNLPRKILSLAETTKDNLPVSLGLRSPFDRVWHIQVHQHILNKITESPLVNGLETGQLDGRLMGSVVSGCPTREACVRR